MMHMVIMLKYHQLTSQWAESSIYICNTYLWKVMNIMDYATKLEAFAMFTLQVNIVRFNKNLLPEEARLLSGRLMLVCEYCLNTAGNLFTLWKEDTLFLLKYHFAYFTNSA